MRRLALLALATTTDAQRAERSRLVWGARAGGRYVLTPLGLANTVRRALGRPPWQLR